MEEKGVGSFEGNARRGDLNPSRGEIYRFGGEPDESGAERQRAARRFRGDKGAAAPKWLI